MSCYLNSTDHFIEPEQNQLASNLPTSRREFLAGATLAVIGLSRPVSVAADFSETAATQRTPGFNDLHRMPVSVLERRSQRFVPFDEVVEGALERHDIEGADEPAGAR